MPKTNLVPLSPQPLYEQIKDTLRGRILDGTYAPHSQMPSEHELCALFGVSRITVRQALGDLQKEGLLFKLHGKGTFVSKPKAFQNVTSLQGFGEAMSSMGYEIVPVAQFSYRRGEPPCRYQAQPSRGRAGGRDPSRTVA